MVSENLRKDTQFQEDRNTGAHVKCVTVHGVCIFTYVCGYRTFIVCVCVFCALYMWCMH